MPRARLTDDGRTVTLDLHGVRVDEALALVRRTAALAARRGRTSLRVVHGASTSDPLARNLTIRHALHDALDGGALAAAVVDAVRFEGVAVLALAAAPRPDPARLHLRDVSP
jgi:DNA-nicking Smr family endonuclease